MVRCLPKMSPSSSTHTASQIATWRRCLTWTRHDFSFDLRLPSTGKMLVWSPAFLPEPGLAWYFSAPSITIVWSNYQTSYNDFFEVYITETVTLSPVQFNQSLYQQSMSRDQSFFFLIHWSKSPSAENSVMIIHKYVIIVIFRHQLLDLSKIDNGWSLAVTVLQRKASMQQIGLPISASN